MNKKKLKRQVIEDLNKEYKIKLDFENIEEVLEGRKPASERDIKDLITLYGRKFDFDLTFVDTNNEIKFKHEIPTIKKYDLSKVDLSEIKYFEDLFNGSLFDGNLNDLKFTEKNNLTGLFENFNYKNASFEKGNFPYEHENVKNWLENNKDNIKIEITENKIEYNNNLLKSFLEENNVKVGSELEKEITEAYHKVNSKLKIEIEDLKKKQTFAAAYIADTNYREKEFN